MPSDLSCIALNNCNNTDAKLDYKLFCTNSIRMYDITYGGCSGLSLVPGSATDISNLICCRDGGEIILPGCGSFVTKQKTVQIDNPCQTLCVNNCACDSCLIWTSTNKRASVSTAQIGDTITYTVEFTNHSAVLLDSVQIFDTLPPGVSVIPGSIQPAPKPQETLQTGISIGSLPPGQTAELRYSVSVNYAVSCDIVNRACVRYCYLDCSNCCRYGLGSCKCSSVRIVNAGLKITKHADKTSVCCLCEEIVYTLKISNPCSTALTNVVVYDNIPQGLCYKTSSTIKDGCGPTNENPQSGIYIGTLCPGQIYTVSFVLYVCSEPCCKQTPVTFDNTAYVYGNTCDDVICAESNSWSVEMNSRCLCQCIQKNISVCDLKRFILCYVYNTNMAWYDIGRTKRVVAGFGICVKYIDCNGKIKKECYEDHISFNNLPNRFNPHSYNVKFKNLVCSLDCDGKLNTKFEAKLRYCLI